MRRLLTVLAGLVVLALVGAAPAAAITGGRPDGNAHPYVGIVLTADGALCSGSLLSPTVFLTAGHCTYYFTESGAEEVYVSFDPQVTARPRSCYTAGDLVHPPRLRRRRLAEHARTSAS